MLPAAWDKVTVFHLLTHSAGIPNFTSFDEYSASRTQATTLDALIARFRGKLLDFAPGERHSYSNSGYVLLTAIIEKASGQPYAGLHRRELVRPLGMADSGAATAMLR